MSVHNVYDLPVASRDTAARPYPKHSNNEAEVLFSPHLCSACRVQHFILSVHSANIQWCHSVFAAVQALWWPDYGESEENDVSE